MDGLKNMGSLYLKLVMAILSGFFFVSVVNVYANSYSTVGGFEIPDGAYDARFVRNLDKVTQIQFSGNYNMYLDDGKFNMAARAVVAQEFYKNHADKYDMLIVFSDTYVDTGSDVSAFNLSVKNEVKGINKHLFDNSDLFGSNGKLTSYIDMAEVGRWDLDSSSANYYKVMNTALHEIMHQWVVGIHVMDNGVSSDIFIGHKNSHWSALLDSDASLMYGQDWMEVADDQYLAYDERQRYSALDLYLAGFYHENEVGPIHYIESADLEKTAIYQKGVRIVGKERIFSIEDVIAAEGKRIPDYQAAQKKFKIGLLYLTKNSEVPDSGIVHNLNKFAEDLSLRFAHYTGGRAFVNIVNIDRAELEELAPEDESLRSEISTDLALSWLKAKQINGFWEDSNNTRIRDSYVANQVLSELDGNYSEQEFLDWSGMFLAVNNTDDAAYLSLTNYNLIAPYLISSRHDDNGWGLSPDHKSTIFDTATILGVQPKLALSNAMDFIYSKQNSDGGWPRGKVGKSDFKTTAVVFHALSEISQESRHFVPDAAVVSAATNYISDYYFANPDEVLIEELAMVLASTSVIGRSSSALISAIISRIEEQQRTDGSWEGSVYATAMVLDALFSAEFANLEIKIESDFSGILSIGEPVQFSSEIRNTGAVDASDFNISLYVDAVSPENLIATETIAFLPSGAGRSLDWAFDTEGFSGNHRAILVADPESKVIEKTLIDNQAFRDFSISSLAKSVDVGIYSSDLVVSPSVFNSAIENIELSAIVRNLSSVDCDLANISLLSGENQLAHQVVKLSSGAKSNILFNVDIPYSDSLFVQVSCDGDTNLSNNIARIGLSRNNTFDAQLVSVTSHAGGAITLGKEIDIAVKIYNSGTQTLPASAVLLKIEKDGVIKNSFTSLVSIDSGMNQIVNFNWMPSEAGVYSLYAYVDQDNLVSELDETNNSQITSIEISLDKKPNLNLLHSDIQYEGIAYEGGNKAFNITVRNTGSKASDASLVHLYKGKPFTESNLLDEAPLPSIIAGGNVLVDLYWNNISASGKQLLYVVLDPSDTIDEASEEDNYAFFEMQITSLPDLHITDSQLKLDPVVALPESDVVLHYNVVNIGGQEAANFGVEIYLNGQLLDHNVYNSVGAYSSQSLEFIIPSRSIISDSVVKVVLDSDNKILESDEENNEASVDLVVGDSSLYVTQRYISPNGDGKQDYTLIYASVPQDNSLNLVVNNSEGINLGSLDTGADGQLKWYGTLNGKRLEDGDYWLRLTNSEGKVVSEQLVVIDTNNTSISEIFSSDKKIEIFYQEMFGNIAWLEPYNEGRRVVFYVVESDNQIMTPGIYTADFTGNDVRLVAFESSFKFSRNSHNNYRGNQYFNVESLSAAGNSLILKSHDSSYYRNPIQYVRIGLNDNTWQPLLTATEFSAYDFYYDYYGILLAVSDGVLYRIDTSTGNSVAVTDRLSNDYDYWYIQRGNLIDKDTLVYKNIVVSFKDLTVNSYGDSDGVTLSANKIAYTDSNGNIVVENRDGSDQKVFPKYRSDKATLDSLMAMASFSPSEDKLMLFFPDSTQYPGVKDWDWLNGENGGLYDYLSFLKENPDSEKEPAPNGYRVELDLNTGLYSVRSNYNYYITTSSGEMGAQYSVLYGDHSQTSQGLSEFSWNDSPMAFEGCDKGRYFNEEYYLDRSFYVIRIPEYESDEDDSFIRSVSPEFIQGAVDYTKIQGVSPFVTGFSYESYDILPNRSFLFMGAERYGDSGVVKHRNTMPGSKTCHSLNVVSNVMLLNTLDLSAYLDVRYEENNKGLAVYAIADDRNFDSFLIEYRKQGDPEWKILVPETKKQKHNDFITTWVPDIEGSYTVRIKVQDLAGNTDFYTTSVVWSESANISGIRINNALFSPNFDTVWDSLSITFKVLRPANILLDITSMSGESVVERIYSFDQVGVVGNVGWDGRNANGAVVADGLYKISLDGYVYYATVDTTPPSITNRSDYPRISYEDSERIKSAIIFASAEDINGIQSFAYQHYVDSQWQNIDQSDLDFELKGKGLKYFNDHSYRVVAVDNAGNKTVSVLLEEAFNTLLYLDGVHNQKYPDNKQAKFKFGPDGKPIPILYEGLGGYALLQSKVVDETSELKILNVVYTDLINEQDLDLSQAISISYSRDEENIFVREDDLTRILSKGGYYVFVLYTNNEVSVSEAIYYSFSSVGNLDFNLKAMITGTFDGYSLGYNFSSSNPDGNISYQLMISSSDPDDSYYSSAVIDGDDIAGMAMRYVPVSVSACSSYSVKAVFDNARELTANVEVPCMPVVVKPVADMTQCNRKAEQVGYQVCLDYKKAKNDIQIKSMRQSAALISKINAYIENENVSNRNYLLSEETGFDGNCFTSNIALPVAFIPPTGEAEITIDLLSSKDSDPVITYLHKLVYEDYFPVINIIYPANDKKICANQLPGTDELYVPIQGSLMDNHTAASEINLYTDNELDCKNMRDVAYQGYEQYKNSAVCDLSIQKAKMKLSDNHYRTVIQPELAYIRDLTGNQILNYWAIDNSGNMTCGATRFTVDSSADVIYGSIDAYRFENGAFGISPNGDGVYDDLKITLSVKESINISLSLKDGAGNAYELLSGRYDNNTQLLTVPGESIKLKDGTYSLVLTSTDDCGFSRIFYIDADYPKIVIDTTSPEVAINYPAKGSELYPVTGVFIDVHDRNIKKSVLSFKSSDSGSWSTLKTLHQEEWSDSDGVFYSLPLTGLSGTYGLKLYAIDLLGNSNEVSVDLDLSSLGTLLNFYEAVTDFVSPDGDGVLDEFIGKVNLSRTADLEIKVNSDVVKVYNGLPSGNSSWSIQREVLSDLPDGRHSIFIAASDNNGTELGKIDLIIDTITPKIIIDKIDDGRFGLISASLVEANAKELNYKLSNDAGNVVRNEKLVKNLPDGMEFSVNLSGLEEGAYVLEILAIDKAGHEFSDLHSFTFDITDPLLSFPDTLSENIYLNQKKDGFDLEFSYIEINPKILGVSLDGSSIFSKTTFDDDSLSLSFDLSNSNDGVHEINVYLSDVNDRHSETKFVLIMDSQPPVVSLPESGSYITKRGQIVFSVDDETPVSGSLLINDEIEAKVSSLEGSVFWPSDMPDGTYPVTLIVTDSAGNRSEESVDIVQDSIAPEHVVSIKAELSESGVVITWPRSISDDIAGYLLYRNGTEIFDTEQLYYTDPVIDEGIYTYYVVAYDHAGNVSGASPDGILSIDRTPPEIRNVLPSEGEALHGNVNFYADIETNDIASVVTKITLGGEIIELSSSAMSGDKLYLGSWYSTVTGNAELNIVATDESGNQSFFTRTYNVDNTALSAPVGLTAIVSDGNTVTLKWNSVDGSDLAGYQVWRSGVNQSGNLTETKFIQKNLADGIYRYSVVSVDTVGNLSEASDVVEISIDQHAPLLKLVSPKDESFENVLDVLAASDDKDIASVNFELRNMQGIVIDTFSFGRPPYATTFDTTSINYDNYSLVIKSTDLNGNTSEQAFPVVKADKTSPEAASEVSLASVDGHMVVTWAASSSEDILRYKIQLYGDFFSEDFLIDEGQVNATENLSFTFTSEIVEGQYYARVLVYDENGNESTFTDSASVPYYLLYPVFPYSPVSQNNIDIPVSTHFSGMVMMSSGSVKVISDNIAAGDTVFLPLDLSSPQEKLTIQGYYDGVSSTAYVPFLMERGTKPETPDVQLESRDNDQITISFTESLDPSDRWFYTLNGRMPLNESAYSYRYHRLSGFSRYAVNYSIAPSEDWLAGIEYQYDSRKISIVSIDVWNGTNWMTIPYSMYQSGSAYYAQFDYPVFASNIRMVLASVPDETFNLSIRPVVTTVYDSDSSVVITETSELLNGIAAEGINLVATVISSDGVIGDGSLLLIEPNSDDSLPDIQLSSVIEEEEPVLNWTTSAAFYSKFYILRDDESIAEVATDGSGNYSIKSLGKEGINHYQIIGLTPDGLTRSSNIVSVSLTLTAPDSVENLFASFDNNNWSVLLSWEGSTEGIVYDVYRKHLLQQEYEKIASVSGLIYHDTSVQSSTLYQYYVVAVRSVSYPDQSSAPSTIVSVVTDKDAQSSTPEILYPYQDEITGNDTFEVISSSLPDTMLNFYVNTQVDASLITNAGLSESIADLPYTEAHILGDKSPYVGYYEGSIFDFSSGESLGWVDYDFGEVLYKGGGAAVVKKYSDIRLFHKDGSTHDFYDIEDVDISRNGDVLAYTNSSGFEIRYSNNYENTITIENNSLFSSGLVAFSPSGQYLAVFRNSYLWIINIKDPEHPDILNVSNKLSGTVYDIYWLSEDRLMLDGDVPSVLSNDGGEVVNFDMVGGVAPYVLGHYGSTVVLLYFNNSGSVIEGYSITSGRLKYRRFINQVSSFLSEDIPANFVTAYGQICSSDYSGTLCSDLPGITRASLNLNVANNQVYAESVFDDGNRNQSLSRSVYRSVPDVNNVELAAEANVRSLGRVSDFSVNVIHREGDDVNLRGITAKIIWPSGKVETLTFLNDNVTVQAGSTYDITHQWVPPEAGLYTMSIQIDADDDVAADNRMELSFTVVEKGQPSLALYLNDNQSIAIEFNTLAWSGTGSLSLNINSPVYKGNSIVTDDRFSSYESHSYELSPGYDSLWLYDFVAEVTLKDEFGNNIASSSISHRGDFLSNRTSELTFILDGDSIAQEEDIAATYTINVHTESLFTGILRVSALSAEGVLSVIYEKKLWYLLDDEIIKENLTISSKDLMVGNYKILAELVDSNRQTVDISQHNLVINPVPVVYTGSIHLSGNPVLMNSECSMKVMIDGSVSNRTEQILVYSSVEGLSGQEIANISSTDLPVELDVDIRNACTSLGDKKIELSVIPDGRERQLLSQEMLNVVDGIPPSLSIETPMGGGYVNANSTASVLAKDGESGVSQVYLLNSEKSKVSMPLTNVDRYQISLSMLSEGSHGIQFEAYDMAGNYTTSDIISIVMDKTPPEITLSGASNDEIYSVPVTLKAIGRDDYLDIFSVRLNGESVGSDELIVSSDGSHKFEAIAIDKSGNTTQKSLTFMLDQQAPRIIIFGIADGAVYTETRDYSVQVTDDNVKEIRTTLNGEVVGESGHISADGKYTLEVSAVDFAGNATHESVEFFVDTTPPESPTINISNGQQFDDPDVVVKGMGEIGSRFVMELNGIKSETSITNAGYEMSLSLSEGINLLSYWAVDSAGNSSVVTRLSLELISLPQFDISVDTAHYSRILVWLPRNKKRQERIMSFVQNSFAGSGVNYQFVDAKNDLIEQLRSHSYSAILVTGSITNNVEVIFDFHLMSEIRAMIASGLGFVSIGSINPFSDLIGDVCGIVKQYSDIDARRFTIDDPDFGRYQLSLNKGSERIYVEPDIRRIGTYQFNDKCWQCENTGKGVHPPILDRYYGRGRVILAGFDLTEASPESSARDLLTRLIEIATPVKIEGYSWAWGRLKLVSEADELPHLQADIAYDTDKASIYVNNVQIVPGTRIDVLSEQVYEISFLDEDSVQVDMNFIYNNSSVLNKSLNFENPAEHQRENWRLLRNYLDNIDVPWYRLLAHYRIKRKVYESEIYDFNALSANDIADSKHILLDAIGMMKISFYKDSEYFDELAGRIINILNAKERRYLFEK